MFLTNRWTVSLALGLLLAPNASADVLAPGTRGIDHQAWVDPGKFADHLWLEYVVEQGDTLSSIAKERLGDAKAWRRIAEANRLGDADSLKLEQKLLIPPRVVGAAGYHLFVLIEYPFHQPAHRVQLNRPLPYFKSEFQLVAVQEGSLARFEGVARPGKVGEKYRWDRIEEAVAAEDGDWLCVAKTHGVERSVSVVSLTRSMVTTFELTSLGERELGVKVKKVVKNRGIGRSTGSDGSGVPVAMMSLGLGSLGCLFLLRRRRRDPGHEA